MARGDRRHFRWIRRELAPGLLTGVLWGLAEYLGNILFLRLHWGLDLAIVPYGLFRVLLSYAALGILLGLIAGGILRLTPQGRRGAPPRGEDVHLRIFGCSFIAVLVSAFPFFNVIHPHGHSPPGGGSIPHLLSLALLLSLAFFVWKWIVGRRVPRGKPLALLSIVGLIGCVGFLQYLSVFHRLDARTDLPAPVTTVARPDLPDILLVTVDTLRRDHLGCYGNPEVRSETIDALARRGVLFERAVTPVPLTLPSHASIMTSLYPESHGVLTNAYHRLPPDVTTVAEILAAAGYRTAAFVSSIVLSGWRGIDQGFEHYDDEEMSVRFTLSDILTGLRSLGLSPDFIWWKRIPRLAYRRDFSYRTAEYTTNRASAWVRDAAGGERPFFLWVHYYDPHFPLDPPEPYASMYPLPEARKRTIQAKQDSLVVWGPRGERLRQVPDLSHYPGEISYMDDQLARLIRSLEERGTLDNTLIVFTADHGEHLLEHNYFGHSWLLYRPSTAIPLVFSWPKRLPGGTRVDRLVRSIDIVPTILDLLDLPEPSSMTGESLLPIIVPSSPGVAPRRCLVVTYSPDMPLFSCITEEWTFIKTADGTKKELYDNAHDPGQRVNLYDERPALADSLEEILDADRRRFAREDLETKPRIEIDPETAEKLKALGYLP